MASVLETLSFSDLQEVLTNYLMYENCETDNIITTWTTYGPVHGMTRTADHPWKGTYCIKVTNPNQDSAFGKYTTAYPIAPSRLWRFSARVWVSAAEVTDTVTRRLPLIWGGRLAVDQKVLEIAVKKAVDGKIYWSYDAYSAGANWTDTAIEATTGFHLICIFYDWYTAKYAMLIDGKVLGGGAAGSGLDYIGIGSLTSGNIARGTFYIDEVRLNDLVLQSSAQGRAANGDILVTAFDNYYESSNGASFRVFKRTGSDSWSILNTTAGEMPYSSIVTVGANSYQTRYNNAMAGGKIYKTTDNGVTWTVVHAGATGHLYQLTRVVVGTKILCSHWTFSTDVRIGWFETTDNSFTEIALLQSQAGGDTASEIWAIEYGNGGLVGVRRDNGPGTLYQVVHRSTDNWVSFDAGTNMSATWGKIGGMPIVAKPGSEYWMCAYKRRTYNDRMNTLLFRFDPVTLAVVGDLEYPYGDFEVTGEAGNGDMMLGAARNRAYVSAINGTAFFYDMRFTNIIMGGFGALRAQRRRRRAA